MKWLIPIFLLGLIACESDAVLEDQEWIQIESPRGFPPFPEFEDNRISAARIKLGKMLFFEPQLSADGTVSCANCHIQENAFADPNALSFGINGQTGFRNAQPLFNLAWKKLLFRDGGVDHLELSSLNPINNPKEMNNNIAGMLSRLKQRSDYADLYQKAYQDTISALSTLKALAVFMRTLISGNSYYDQHLSNPQQYPLNAEEQLGKELFFSSKTSCASCHGGFNFGFEVFKSNGLFEQYADSGRQRITISPSDRGKFLIPSLRNIEITAPYMHDGSINTLEEVIERYNSGGTYFTNKDTLIKPLGLSQEEKSALMAFLLTLTDNSFVQNPAYKP